MTHYGELIDLLLVGKSDDIVTHYCIIMFYVVIRVRVIPHLYQEALTMLRNPFQFTKSSPVLLAAQ